MADDVQVYGQPHGHDIQRCGINQLDSKVILIRLPFSVAAFDQLNLEVNRRKTTHTLLLCHLQAINFESIELLLRLLLFLKSFEFLFCRCFRSLLPQLFTLLSVLILDVIFNPLHPSALACFMFFFTVDSCVFWILQMYSILQTFNGLIVNFQPINNAIIMSIHER